MIVRGNFETYPDHIHKLWKEIYFIWGKVAPEKYEQWWGTWIPSHKYYGLVDAIVAGGELHNEAISGAFSRYVYWDILETDDDNTFYITDKYIDFLGTI